MYVYCFLYHCDQRLFSVFIMSTKSSYCHKHYITNNICDSFCIKSKPDKAKAVKQQTTVIYTLTMETRNIISVCSNVYPFYKVIIWFLSPSALP